jgi:hypothetical protein
MRPALASTASTMLVTDASSVTSQVSIVTPSDLAAAGRRLVPKT